MQIRAVVLDVGVLDLARRLRVVAAVDQEGPATRRKAGPNQSPKSPEPHARHVREPEGEKHNVIGPLRLPGEKVGNDVLHVGPPDAVAVELKGLWRSIQDGQARSCADETLGPPPRAARHLKDVTSGAERTEGSLDLRDLAVPLLGQLRASVVEAAPLPPFVVLGCTRPIESLLLGEEPLVTQWHFPSLSQRPGQAVARLIADAIRPIYDYPGTFADSLAPHAARFGLRKGDGLGLLRWLLDMTGDPGANRWMDDARAHVDREKQAAI